MNISEDNQSNFTPEALVSAIDVNLGNGFDAQRIAENVYASLQADGYDVVPRTNVRTQGMGGRSFGKADATRTDRNTTADALDEAIRVCEITRNGNDSYELAGWPIPLTLGHVRDAARLLRTPDTPTDSEQWYITNTGPAFYRHNIISGPFTTREDALTARTSIEAIARTNSYWVRPASEMTGGAS